MSLNSKAMIVTLNISSWTARKLDRKVSDEIAEHHGANKDQAGNFNKQLLPKKAIKKVQTVVGAARTFHIENTLPWGQNNDRLLPTKNYYDYTNGMREIKDNFEIVVRDFIKNYAVLRESQRVNLGDMFNEADYPDPNIIGSKYKFDIGFGPIPDANDFRVAISDEERDELREAIEERVAKSTEVMTTGLWKKLMDKVEYMNMRLSKDESKFKDSLVTNIREVCELLPKLNVLDDPNLRIAIEEVESNLAHVDPQDLRNDDGVRSETQKKAEEILERMKGYC